MPGTKKPPRSSQGKLKKKITEASAPNYSAEKQLWGKKGSLLGTGASDSFQASEMEQSHIEKRPPGGRRALISLVLSCVLQTSQTMLWRCGWGSTSWTPPIHLKTINPSCMADLVLLLLNILKLCSTDSQNRADLSHGLCKKKERKKEKKRVCIPGWFLARC